MDSAFALDGFEENGDDTGRLDGEAEGIGIIEGNVGETWDGGFEAFFDFILARGGDARESSAVERSIHGDDCGWGSGWVWDGIKLGWKGWGALVAEFSGKFVEGFVGFGAAIAEKDFSWGTGEADEAFGELGLG